MEQRDNWLWTQVELKTVPRCFYDTCEKFPERPAQLFNPELYHGDGGGSFTWAQVRERVDAIAGGLLGLGIDKNDNVAIMAPSGPYWTHADMAITACAAVSVTIYPTLSLGEVLYIINDSSSRYLFVGSRELLDMVLPAMEQMPSLRKIIVMDLDWSGNDERVIGLGSLVESGKSLLKSDAGILEKRWKSVAIEDPYTILYTSGTTGQGKGAVLTHWSVSTRMEGVKEYFARYGMSVDENDVTLCFLPLSHIFDRGSCQLLAIYRGACISYADKPGTLLADMQKYNPSWINCVPRLYEKIYITFQQQMAASSLKKKIFDWALGVGEKAAKYRMDEKGCYDMTPSLDLAARLPLGLRIRYKIADRLFSKVRALFGSRFRLSFSASAAISPDLLRFFYILGFAVIEGYGSTESCNACILNPLTACRPGYIGLNANGSYARVAADGELEISGAGIFKGYLNKDSETAESFTPDGWFKTGDIVRLDEHGFYKFIERKKAIICTASGKNVAPAKLENLFSTSSVIEQVFCIGDERNFISALLVPNFNFFIDYFEKEKITFDRDSMEWSEATGVRIYTRVGEDFIGAPALRKLIDAEVEEANKKLENFERIKKYTILPARFTEENGMLTPTQKAKKRVILEVYREAIDEMYR